MESRFILLRSMKKYCELMFHISRLMLAPGTTFNIFVRTRQNGSEWTSINLEVVDDDYKDGKKKYELK